MIIFDSKIYERDIYEDSIYSAWLKYSTERDVLERVFRDRVNEWCNKENISILDIGCGTGSAAKRVFKILDEKGISFSYTGVDPYQDQIMRFKEDFSDKSNVELIVSKIENFKIDKKFDLVIVVHALYYVDSFEETLKKIMSIGKKIIIVHHGEYGINEIHEAFREYVKEGPNIISTYKDVAITLDRLGIKYDLKVYDTVVNISCCKDPNNKDGNKLIKFFLEHSVLSDGIISKVSSWFKKRPDIIKHDVGYFFINTYEK